ncbi:MAG: hypothetical protein VBE63_16185 [Lamprobacter sp.]|uniref:hypothetical protein n=1 Tax=Lamprobacter sp. TaxID=3100796 RepID=UPI002B261132|nr:hypothetical protein [Lamprobacter sp.]MEA3641464.1 hypothetical protein [Lamprobacter sp.]
MSILISEEAAKEEAAKEEAAKNEGLFTKKFMVFNAVAAPQPIAYVSCAENNLKARPILIGLF